MDQAVAAEYGIAWGQGVIDEICNFELPVWTWVVPAVLLNQLGDDINADIGIQIDLDMLEPVAVAAGGIDQCASAQPGQNGGQFTAQRFSSLQRRTGARPGLGILP